MNRRPFLDHYTAAEARLRLKYTPEQIAELKAEFGLMAPDAVTGFHEGRSGPGRVDTVVRAVRHAAGTGETAFYLAMDLQNLGGLNARLSHSGANEVYRVIAAIIRRQLEAAASAAVFFRHGGDEMSAVLVHTTRGRVESACEKVERSVRHLAGRRRIDDTPHPKHPDRPDLRGIGVHFGICNLRPDHAADPAAAFGEADAQVEEAKRRKSAVLPGRGGAARSSQERARETLRLLEVCATAGLAAVVDAVAGDRGLMESLAAACHRANLTDAGWYLQYLAAEW